MKGLVRYKYFFSSSFPFFFFYSSFPYEAPAKGANYSTIIVYSANYSTIIDINYSTNTCLYLNSGERTEISAE